jgi:hypothetical protein
MLNLRGEYFIAGGNISRDLTERLAAKSVNHFSLDDAFLSPAFTVPYGEYADHKILRSRRALDFTFFGFRVAGSRLVSAVTLRRSMRGMNSISRELVTSFLGPSCYRPIYGGEPKTAIAQSAHSRYSSFWHHFVRKQRHLTPHRAARSQKVIAIE